MDTTRAVPRARVPAVWNPSNAAVSLRLRGMLPTTRRRAAIQIVADAVRQWAGGGNAGAVDGDVCGVHGGARRTVGQRSGTRVRARFHPQVRRYAGGHPREWVVLPHLFYTPETGVAGGGVVGFYPGGGLGARPSSVVASVTVTARRQVTADWVPEVYLAGGSLWVTGSLRAMEYPDVFYGIGRSASHDMEEHQAETIFQLEPGGPARGRGYPGLGWRYGRGTGRRCHPGQSGPGHCTESRSPRGSEMDRFRPCPRERLPVR
jgi:hypothetical protein